MMDKTDIEITVELAQMELSDAEMNRLGNEVQAMLEYFAQMNAVNVDGVEATTHSLQKAMRVRPDTIVPSTLSDMLLEQAPETEGRLISLPNVL